MTTIGQMTVTTPSDTEIAMTRAFNAPRRFVYEAFVTPDLIKRWLTGKADMEMPVCDIDLRVGGRYRHEWAGNGMRFGTGGEYREIVPGERIVHTEAMDGFPGECVVTNTFAESGGKTTMTMVMRFQTKEARDGALKSGMADGVEYSYGRLDDILASMRR
jgi:uncharacterized protein YndB with AHSA1/START domain